MVGFGRRVHGADIRWVPLEGPLERGQQQHAVEAGTATPVSRRSFERLQIEDLRRLAASAMENPNRFVEGNREKYGWCENHLLMLCLCQGAAEHYVRGERGVKDFDVWAFYEAQTGEKPFPWRRYSTENFGHSRFGRNPCDEGYTGWRINVFGRSITRKAEQSPEGAVLDWVHSKRKSARHIMTNPVVATCPERDCGRVIWDPRDGSASRRGTT